MSAIDFVVRTRAGAIERGSVGGGDEDFLVNAQGGQDISLNLSQSDLRGYDRAADDLLITLADGRVIVLEGYFSDSGDGSRLFLSSGGELNQVSFVEADGGALFAQYGPTETWGKWSPTEELIFVDDPQVALDGTLPYDPEGEEVSMLGAGLLGAAGAGMSGIGAAGLGTAALIAGAGSGGGGGGGGSDDPIVPTVDDPDNSYDIGGGDDPAITITGTGEPGSDVVVTIGEEEVTTQIGEDGTWEAIFTGEDFPADGIYNDIPVVVTNPDGDVTNLDGPSFEIDTTPPALEATEGTVSLGDLFNGEDHQDGVEISGSAEAGSSLTIAIGEYSETVVVGEDGSWSFTFDATVLPAGEYTQDVVITATDSFGNSTVINEQIQIDTVNEVTLGNAPLTGDDMINAGEYAAGVTLTGTSQAGSTVEVTIEGQMQSVTADGDGNWSVTFDSSMLAEGTYSTTAQIVSTDISGNVVTMSHTFNVDTEAGVTVDTSTVAADGIVNAVEHGGTVTVGGTGEAGSSIEVAINGNTWSTTVGDDGTWSVDIGAGFLPAGTTVADVSVTSTDLAGNISTASGGINIDTQNDIAMATGNVEGDGTVNAAERADGVVLNGVGEAGAAIEVTVGGTVLNTVVDASGSWSVTIPADNVPTGTTTMDVTAVSTDAAGNVATATGTINIDTETNVSVMTANVEGEGVVNAAERSDGVVLTGQAEAGASVQVTMGSVTHTAVVASDGSWTANFAASDLPTGETTLDVTAVSTDAAGNTATATGTVDVDTLVRDFDFTSTPGGADGVINAEEASQGLTMTGTTEPGGTVDVTLDGVTVPATVAADGSWSASFSAAQLPSGDRTVTMTAVSTDLAGNSDTISQQVRVDTDAGLLTISPAPVEGDDMVNFAEASDGVVLTGTSTPFQSVDVTMNGVTHTVTTDASGIWTAPFAASEIAPGTYTADITATITDSAGNTLTRTDSVDVDTEVLNFGVSSDPVEGDNVINADEASDGFTLAGTTEPGGTVAVTFNGVTRAATVDGDGNWSVDFSVSEIPAGEHETSALIQTTDVAGNTAETTTNFDIDTEVNRLNVSTDPTTRDDIVNAEEAAQGFEMSGQVEVGSTVVVTFGGVAHTATVNSNGGWTVDIPPGSILPGTGPQIATVEATDLAGNTRTVTETINVDTEAPGELAWEGYGRNHEGVDQIRTEISDDTVEIGRVIGGEGSSPSVVGVALESQVDVDALDLTFHSFSDAVPDGSHLVLTSTDGAGNVSSSYLVTDDLATSEVTMTDDLASTLSGFNIETIDLQFAEDSHLTITEAQLTALSSNSDTLVVHGGVDDSVTITGAQAAGTQTEGGETYNVFTLGDATLLIDDDITNVSTNVV
ncbi:Ig-like domain-containing protein [uncultured Pelagimonas sp.]|uniref:Ig-like domain-containing protein n=1 Tax=uncultured Pelagimonas sp. TaxID=1618102 RepID=UPI00261C20CE|nr:Ig-like domain-containing protein [uncultured Pelagimonas sp.]